MIFSCVQPGRLVQISDGQVRNWLLGNMGNWGLETSTCHPSQACPYGDKFQSSSRYFQIRSSCAPVHLPVHLKAVCGGSFPFRWREGFQDGEIEDILSVASA